MFGPYAIAIGRGAHRHALGERAALLDMPVRIEMADLLLVGAAGTSVLKGLRSILVGQIFTAGNECLHKLPPALESWGAQSHSHEAPPNLWGNFAFFWATPDRASVYREPSGSVPVYRCGEDEQAVFVSDAKFARDLGLLEDPVIDRRFLAHWLQYPFLRTRRTGVLGFEELLPGMLISTSGSGGWVECSAWHPSTFAAKTQAAPEDYASRLRSTALDVVGLQLDFANMLVSLSGGLDSSIIASCLKAAGREFGCINFATLSREGDEREHAREVASALGVNLIEIGELPPAPLELPGELSFRPLINPLLAPFETAIAAAAQKLDAALFIDGAGGDNLFCSVSSAAPVIDALISLKFGDAAAVVRDIASRANCTLWEVLLAAGRRLRRRRPAWKEDRSFLRSECLLGQPELHPWLQQLPVPPGKREHVEALVHIQHFLDRSSPSLEQLHPLLAQPLLELCLQIPSWLWLRGGRDRPVARDAIRGLLPDSILKRRMKGSLQGMLYRSFSALRETMRELLTSGELAEHAIVNPSLIDEALQSEAWMTDEVQLRISEMVALELWLRSWRGIAATAA